jgi:putative PIN family toxin of toxin-antitoxin system
MRAVVDTNVWISALLNPAGAPARVLGALRAGRFTLLISAPLLEELARVSGRPRLTRRYGLVPDDAARLLALLAEVAEPVAVAGAVRVCRDPRDDVVLETAVNGRAAALVSRDEDLTRAPEVAAALGARGVAVLTVRAFLDALDAPAGDTATR